MKTVFNFKKMIASTALLAVAMGVSLTAGASSIYSGAGITFGNNVPAGGYNTYVTDAASNSGQVTDTGDYFIDFSGFDEYGNAVTTNFSGRAYSQSAYGMHKTYATATLINPIAQNDNNPPVTDENFIFNPNGMPDFFQVDSTAQFSDTLTILSSPNLSYIELQLLLSGEVSGDEDLVDGFNLIFSSDVPSASATMTLAGTGIGVISSGSNVFFDQTFNQVLQSNLIPVLNNQISLALSLFSTVSFNGLQGGKYSGTSDFFHTLTVASIVGYDANGQQVNLASAIGASGTHYTVAAPVNPGASIPEPATLALLGIGLVSMGWTRRRQS